MKIPTHPEEFEFSEVRARITKAVSGTGVAVDLLVDNDVPDDRTVWLTPGGAVLLAEQLLKAARKASA